MGDQHALSAVALIELVGRRHRGLDELAELLADDAEKPATSPTAIRLEHFDVDVFDDAVAVLGHESPGIACLLACWFRAALEHHGKDPQEFCDHVRRRELNMDARSG